MRVLLLAASLLWLIACLWFPLTDTDIWWHLASAKLMLSTKAFLRADPFCQSSLGAPWTDLHWGFQILAYAAWKSGGARALVAGKCVALAAALGFALKPHLDRRTLPWLLPLAAFGLYHIRFFIDVRPLVLTLPGLGIEYTVVIAYLRGRRLRPWWILAPVQVAMVNVQGLYLLGPFLVTCMALGEYAGRRWPAVFSAQADRDGYTAQATRPLLRPLLLTCAALWFAGIASPYGLRGFLLPFSLFGRIAPVATNIFSTEIAENLPLSDLLRRDPGAALPFLILGSAMALTFGRGRSPGSSASRISLGHAVLFLAFSALGWMAQRNLPLSLLAGLMAAGSNLQASLGSRREGNADGAVSRSDGDGARPRMSRLPEAWAGFMALALIALIYCPKVRAAWEYELPGSLETPFRFPAPAVDWLEAHPIPGNLFNELRYGGYVEFRLFPGLRTFVDGRMILRTAAFYRDFLDAVDHPEGFPGYRARYAFTHALLPISEDRRFLPLAAWLIREGGWGLYYCDGASALLADTAAVGSYVTPMDLNSLPPGHPLSVALHRRFSSNPRLETMAVQNAALLLKAAGHDRAAADLLGH